MQFCQFIQHLQVDSKILIKTSKTLSEGSLSDMKIIKLFVYKVLAYTKEEIIKSELQIDFSKVPPPANDSIYLSSFLCDYIVCIISSDSPQSALRFRDRRCVQIYKLIRLHFLVFLTIVWLQMKS